MNPNHPTGDLRLPWYFALAIAIGVILCNPMVVIGEDSGEQKPTSKALSLDALDSLEKTAEKNSSNSNFSLKLLDNASPGSEGSKPVEFAPQLWTDNLRFAVDLAYRPTYSGRTGSLGGKGFVGIDLHKVFTDKQGDWGTLTLQTYLTRVDNVTPRPSGFEDRHDFEIENRISNFNYTRHGKGKTNFRIGHFEIPFGLEQVVNTNGTLRDFTHFQNFGVKSDWGVTFNGETDGLEYELGLSRGSGNVWRRRDDPFIVAGRVGTDRTENVVFGVSAFHGEVLSFAAQGGTVERSRIGADFTFADENLVWMTEFSAGFENDERAYTALFEVDWADSKETVLLYNQLVIRGFDRSSGWDNELRNSFGVRWSPNQKWAASGQLSHFLDPLLQENRGTVVEFQMRYRF